MRPLRVGLSAYIYNDYVPHAAAPRAESIYRRNLSRMNVQRWIARELLPVANSFGTSSPLSPPRSAAIVREIYPTGEGKSSRVGGREGGRGVKTTPRGKEKSF